jgi:putative ABC transport system ATP-binding protein
MSGAAALVAFDDVHRDYDDGRVSALAGVSLSIAPGETVAIVGRSGSGKSTLVHLAAGLDSPSAGRVRFDGRRVAGRRAWTRLRATRIGIVFQAFFLLPSLSALGNVMAPMLGVERDHDRRRRRAADLLDRVGLAHRGGHRPSQLSGGERQRVAIARALANRPSLLLADEPTGNLDSASAEGVLSLMFETAAEAGAALVVVSHDPALAARAGRQLELLDGRVVADSAASGAA